MQRMKRQRVYETLDARLLLAGDLKACDAGLPFDEMDGPEIAIAADVEPQFRVNQTPRIQLGNAPLIGTPSYDGFDQVEILWQTVEIGNGDMDEFIVEIRDADANDSIWRSAAAINQIDTGIDSRIVHSAAFNGLQWDHLYEYRVTHSRAGAVVDSYQHEFQTRLRPGDVTPFSFAAYGDSAINDDRIAGFRSVQRSIAEHEVDFSVLLGDNIYDTGSHSDADARFDPDRNPEATNWIASHVDYFTIGNHDIAVNGGKPSRDSYSMPIPVRGENSHADPPIGEFAEHFSSFDYGNVHFVTFDSNSAEMSRGEEREERIQRQVDFLVADLQASTATWKIVYMHHPMVGSVKLRLYPDTKYQEILMPALIDAGVDLIMSGDSHTFAWSYPICELEDADGNGRISDNEFRFNANSDNVFIKGDGVVNLISGAGGKNLRSDPFGQPYIAEAYSASQTTAPLDFGFAKVEVSESELKVQYISAESGRIMGDTNQNGLRDEGETYFGEFRITNPATLEGDFNLDSIVDASDIDLLCQEVRDGGERMIFDLNADGIVDSSDLNDLIERVLGSRFGDSNLDGMVDSKDLVLIFQAGEYEDQVDGNSGWAEGDWNCDGDFDSRDLVELFQSL